MLKSFRFLFLLVVMIGSLVAGPAAPVRAASLPAEINKQFTPLQIASGGVSVLRITIFNPNSFPLTDVAFVDDLLRVQPGLYIANPAGVVNNCNGTLSAAPGSTTISLSGGMVPAQTGPTPGQCFIEVNISSVTPGNLINTIPAHNPPDDVGLTAKGDDGGTIVDITNTSPASATLTVVGVTPPSLSKSFSPSTIWVGDVSRLSITVRNNDQTVTLTQTSFTDTLPANVLLADPVNPTLTGCGASASVTANPGGNTITLNNGTILPGQNCVVGVDVTSGTAGVYTNTIPAGPDGPGSIVTQQGVTNGSPASATLNVQPVGITKAFSPTSIPAGGTSTLTITLQNPTGSAYTGVNLTDNLPSGLTVSGTPTTTCGGTLTNTATSVTLTGGVIPASLTPPTPVGTCTITITVTAPLTAPTSTQTNTIPPGSLVTAQGVTNPTAATANLGVQSALNVLKAYSPTTIVVGGTSTITITLQNRTGAPLTGVTFTDNLPANLTVVGVPASPQCGGTVTVNLEGTAVTLTGGTIPASATPPTPPGTCTITFQVTSSVPGSGTTYENTIPANTVATDQGVGNLTTTATGPDLTVIAAGGPVGLTKAFQTNPIQPGGFTRLRIQITAPADTALSGITFTDTLPSGLVVAASPPAPAPTTSCPGGTVTAPVGGNAITLTGASLAAGASCNVDVRVTSTAPNTYVNSMPPNSITTNEGRTNTNTAQSTLRVTSLTVSKAFSPPAIVPNAISTLTITLENTTDSPLINVSLTDNLATMGGTVPTSGVYVANPSNATTDCGGTLTAVPGSRLIELTGGTVPAQSGGVPGTCTIQVDVEGRGGFTTRTNTIPIANVSGTVQSTGTVIAPLAAATAQLTIADLSIGVVKGFDPVLVYGGATSTMTVQLINPNNTLLTGIAFTDNMALLQPGIVLANPVNFNTGTCGGTLTGNPGDSSFSFSGGSLPPNTSCFLTLSVVMEVNGNRTNRIPAGAVTTFNGVSNPDPTEASLTNLPGVSVSKVFDPNPIVIGEAATLTITIRNTSNIPVVNMGLIDNLPGNLPEGLIIADPANATNTCGGSLTAEPGAQTITLAGGGLDGNATCTVAVNVTSTRSGVYVNTIPAGALTSDGDVTNTTPATDTLTVNSIPFSLGNRVWFDTNNNSTLDGTEVGIDGVLVELYEADANGNPTGTALASQTTANGGYYRFDNLPAGDYVVVIPASQFASGGPLAGYWSSGTTISGGGTPLEAPAPNPNNDADNDDNGTLQSGGAFAGAVISGAVTLGPNANEPTNDADADPTNPSGEAPNAQSNRTVDFGFYRLQLGDQIFVDVNGNGAYDAADVPLAGALVQLFAADGVTEIASMTTGVNGTYLFSGLPQGSYIVRVTPPDGYTSTVDTANNGDTTNPNFNIDHNDNGVGTGGGTVSSNLVTLTPGSAGSANNNVVNNATGTTYDPTVDFGFINQTGISKSIIDTSEGFTPGNNVAIGEIVTYEIAIDLSAGTAYQNVTVTDRMDKGLAFVDCVLVELAGTDITDSVCPPTVSAVTNPGDQPTNPANPGRQVEFSIGDILAMEGDSTLLIRYRVVVLDVIENQDTVGLSNNVSWRWAGGSASSRAPNVIVVEPDLVIEKTASPSSGVTIGTPIQFTLTIQHTLQSTTDAFDVRISDFLPSNLEYIPCTIQYGGLSPTSPPAPAYCPDPATDLIFTWDEFPLGASATITFNARLLGSPATNFASVEWTSLPIDPNPDTGLPVQLSTHNATSTERWYDPQDDVNIYSDTSGVSINAPGEGGGGDGAGGSEETESTSTVLLPGFIPVTGFAPQTVTLLPQQPAEKAYTATEIWLEIPRLGEKMPIVGVPIVNEEWDVSWLWREAGWLNGTAFPGWKGNSVLTAHVYLPNGKPGPFANLGSLKWGDRIIVHAYGFVYVYEVRSNRTVSPYNTTVFKHEDDPWLTLITCKDYNEATNTYARRIAVRAVLVDIQTEKAMDRSDKMR